MEFSEEVDIDEEIQPEPDEDGDKEKKSTKLTRHSWETAFSHTDQVSAMKYLVEIGMDPRELLLRTFIPSKRNEGTVLAVAIADALSLCREFDDDAGEQEIQDLLALWPSVDNNRIKLLVDAIIGEIRTSKDRDIGEKIKKLAFGDRSS